MGVISAEAEGPQGGVEANFDPKNMNVGAMAEASLFRVEGKVAGFTAKIQPNLNSGARLRDGKVDVKALGFGLTLGPGNQAIHTPLGTIGRGEL